MEQVIFRPRIYKYDTFKEFAQEKKLSDSDLFIVAALLAMTCCLTYRRKR